MIVDYAHTDDALRNLLEMARPLAARRLITVFGAGGDRDRTKRPLMGMVAARLSDVVVITSDNPRSEDPQRIIDEINLGAQPETRQRDVQRVNASWIDATRFIKAVRDAAAGRPRPDRRKGTREVPGDRRSQTAVRRCGRRARGVGGPTSTGYGLGDELRLTLEWAADAVAGRHQTRRSAG